MDNRASMVDRVYYMESKERSTVGSNETWDASGHVQNSSQAYSGMELADGTWHYKCNLCGETLGNISLLQRHMNLFHKDAYALPFSCSICGQGYFSTCAMRLHKQTHLVGRKHICEICGFKFFHKHHLKRHEKNIHKLMRCIKCFRLFPIESYSDHSAYCIGS